ncbi:hypothetical protein D9757_003757 [Collybiopsis confluens]|uniref:MPN domain-containing protein n=1 Tax=Collybiopsis confluens TaxID=2823264 RepID=A0A8H5HV54_9AGAR|nr:hypothetical protein D9757_003757 [Collybiopsis confluens]
MSSHSSTRRPKPLMISELASRAQQTNWDETGSFKYYLRLAEKYRKDAKEYVTKGNLEEAFVAFARSASIVLEKLPSHRDYHTALNPVQKNNLSLNGQEILDNLGHLKPILLDRYEKWSSQHPDRGDTPPLTQEEVDQAEETRRAQEESDSARRRQQIPPPPSQFFGPSSSFAAHSAVQSARSAAGASSAPIQRFQDNRLRAHASAPSGQSYSGMPNPPHSTSTISGVISSSLTPSATMYHAASREAGSAHLSMPSSASAGYQPPPVSHPNMYSRTISQQGPLILPLENPSRFEDEATDSEHETPEGVLQRYASPARSSRSRNYPAPVTTMSPPPPDRIEYPKLMNMHQQSQGYRPSQDSMFLQPSMSWPTPVNHYSLSNASQRERENYHPLPQPPSQPPYGSVPAGHPPPIPTDSRPLSSFTSSSELSPSDGSLRTVHLPRDCLNRFLTIAKVNTTRDRETCGLLLGKDVRGKYLVTTLLIPKQHSTSDTCTMDEEELILQVTEERGLITLGWIHTHPSQSCFMSSVDLHTHSAFQRMLPESFAVVCAPSSVPNFGIFRLTDPPGLHLILACDVKEAFHPHSDAPIYTDAERGHVQMKDLSLEIVDLR